MQAGLNWCKVNQLCGDYRDASKRLKSLFKSLCL